MSDYIGIADFYDDLLHYGKGHLDGGHSGRYPWGSGDNPYQRFKTFYEINSKLISDGLDIKERMKYFDMSELEYKSNWLMSERNINKNWSYKQIEDKYGLSMNQTRQTIGIAKQDQLAYNIAWCQKLKDTGMSISAISKETGFADTSVRNYLKPGAEEKARQIHEVSEALKIQLDKTPYIQVGRGVSNVLGITDTKLNKALYDLQTQGYTVTTIQVQQQASYGKEGHKTSIKVLGPPGSTYSEIKQNASRIGLPFDVHINNETNKADVIQYPKSLNSSRIKIHYGDEVDETGFTGSAKDGVIELRRGVQDLSLGNSNYAQVRIMVDGKYYIKGMAMYSDNLPDGVDVLVNSNKKLGTPLEKVLKEIPGAAEGKISENPNAVFGATIKAGGQVHYIGKDGKDTIGVINKVNEEGDWDEWSRTLASQMLSKQSTVLARRQLNLDLDKQKLEFQKILDLDNPVIKKQLLDDLANDCDAKAVNLKAAAMPGQRAQVLLPLTKMKDNEIYAPNYNNGDRVVLIRYPHGGTFEIPELIVNNNNKQGKSIIGQAMDAVGVTPKTAEKLSGADFDGDTVLVIPNPKGEIKTSKSLPGLVGFDTKSYKLPEGYPEDGKLVMKESRKGFYMGVASNLITDMTLQRASDPELERAVKYSMVVIDAPKHKLNYIQAANDLGIRQLHEKYQNSSRGGASTLISKAKSPENISKRKAGGYIYDEDGNPILNSKGKPKIFYSDPKTGEKLYRYSPEYYTQYKIEKPPAPGKTRPTTDWVGYKEWKEKYPDAKLVDTRQVERLSTSTKMYERKDAKELSSGTQMENTYADYANSMKALGNKCRLEASKIPTTQETNADAKKKYAKEVRELQEGIDRAKANEPLERQANIMAKAAVDARIEEMSLSGSDEMSQDKIARLSAQELTRARNVIGASGKGTKIQLTDAQWEAIQNGAVTTNVQKDVIRYADKDRLRQLATPKKQSRQVTSSEASLIRSMSASGSTQEEIAKALGISVSTVNSYLHDKN